jgi:hypothetical protein
MRDGIIVHARYKLLTFCYLLCIFWRNHVLPMRLRFRSVQRIKQEDLSLWIEKCNKRYIRIDQLLDSFPILYDRRHKLLISRILEILLNQWGVV